MEEFKKELWDELFNEFRKWNRDWNIYDKEHKNQPPSVDELLEELSKKYILIRR